MPLIRQYPQADTLENADAFVIDRIGVGTMYIDGADVFLTGAPYAAACSFFGQPPTGSQIIGGHFFPVAVTFGENFASTLGASGGYASAAPTVAYTARVNHIASGVSTDIGSMTIATDKTFSFLTDAVTFGAGDSVQFVGASVADATLQDFWWTFMGAVA